MQTGPFDTGIPIVLDNDGSRRKHERTEQNHAQGMRSHHGGGRWSYPVARHPGPTLQRCDEYDRERNHAGIPNRHENEGLAYPLLWPRWHGGPRISMQPHGHWICNHVHGNCVDAHDRSPRVHWQCIVGCTGPVSILSGDGLPVELLDFYIDEAAEESQDTSDPKTQDGTTEASSRSKS